MLSILQVVDQLMMSRSACKCSFVRFVESLFASFLVFTATGVEAKEVAQFLFLIHPCPYEIMEENQPGQIEKKGLEAYLSLEQLVFQRWLKAIPSLDERTFVVQVDMPGHAPGPDLLHESLLERLGAGQVCRIGGEFQSPDKPEALLDYYNRIVQQMASQMYRYGLSYDSTRCVSEIWGQSFEGCAPGYSSAIAERLKLAVPAQFDFAMSVPDARFLLAVKQSECISIPNSDIVAYLFQLEDGSRAALFQARLTAQWLDRRPIELKLDPGDYWVCSKQGKSIWPDNPPAPTDARKPVLYRLSTAEEVFIRTKKDNVDQLRAVVAAARLRALPKSHQQ